MALKKFTDRALRVICLASQEAERHGHLAIGTGHILVALLNEGNGVAANIMQRAGLSIVSLREALLRVNPLRVDLDNRSCRLPKTVSVELAVKLAFMEMQTREQDAIGTEHLLLGLLGAVDGSAVKMLNALNVSPNSLIEGIQRIFPKSASKPAKTA